MEKIKSILKKIGDSLKKIGATLLNWIKRTFMGASKELDQFSVEAIDSPGKQIVKKFFRNKLAIVALSFFFIMFLLVVFGPLVWPMDVNYTETLHKNLAPGYTMMKVPSKLANNVKEISSYSYFSVGLDNDGEVYTWGNTKLTNSASEADLKDIPQEVKDANIVHVAAGIDHCVAIDDKGKVYCWGEYNNGQYGTHGSLAGSVNVIPMPEILLNGTIDVKNVKQVICGYQMSAIVMNDGTFYIWGNSNSGAGNAKELLDRTDIEEIAFLNSKVVALLKDGTLWLGSAETQYAAFTPDGSTTSTTITEYLNGRRITDIAATRTAIAVCIEGKEIVVLGTLDQGVAKPTLNGTEKIVLLESGTRHFTLLTDENNLYSFGSNTLNQCDVPNKLKNVTNVFVGSFQNYVVNGNKIIKKYGLKGYLLGTDDMGRNVFIRIVHGGRMTMSIGAIAVIISSIIGIIVGVLSGYFGGWVDLILMRITEIFGAIPFLPFAIMLSSIFAGKAVSENMRIAIIMAVLGVLSWTSLARMTRGQVLAEREKEFVVAAKAMGVREKRIAFKHVLPNVFSVILVSITLDFAGCMLTEASMSYLGFGVQLPRPTWGNMLDGCNNEIVISHYWWRWLFPALFLLLTTISINIVGDVLRDVMDPKGSKEE